MTLDHLPVPGTTRLRILNSLPRQHQAHFFAEVRKLCAIYIASLRIPTADREAEILELFSEVMAKLLGVTGSGAGPKAAESAQEDGSPVMSGHHEPGRDDRVAWLLAEVRGWPALAHRREDIRRQRYGGKWQGEGYRQVQLDEDHVDNLSVDADEPHHDRDMRRVWRGILVMAKTEFAPTEDISILLELMAKDPEIAEAFGAEWPIRQIADALDKSHPNAPWSDDRVDNAKKRLRNWISRLKRAHGLDSTDLMGLFARYAGSYDKG